MIQTVLDIGEKNVKVLGEILTTYDIFSDIFIKTERYMWLLSTLAASWPKRIFLFNIGTIFRVTFSLYLPPKNIQNYGIIQKFLFHLSRGTVKNKIIIIIIIVKYR